MTKERFILFADTLHDAIIEEFDSFEYEEYGKVETQEDLFIDWGNRLVKVRLWLIISCACDYITTIELDWIDIFDDELNDSIDDYSEELYGIVENAFSYKML